MLSFGSKWVSSLRLNFGWELPACELMLKVSQSSVHHVGQTKGSTLRFHTLSDLRLAGRPEVGSSRAKQQPRERNGLGSAWIESKLG